MLLVITSLIGLLSISDSIRPHQWSSSIAIPQRPQEYKFSLGSSGSNFYWVGAESYDSSVLSNSGIRGTIQVISAPITGCLSFWVADEMASNTVWGQVGYDICNGSTPRAFYEVWNGTTSVGAGTASVSTGLHEFSMYFQSGTTWAYALDGVSFGSYDMGSNASSSSYPVEALSEEGSVSAPFDPPQVEFSTALQVLKSGIWYSSPSGYEPYGCGTMGSSCWGVQGNLQNPALPADKMTVGGNTSLVNAGNLLWNSGTPDFTVIASPTSLTINTGVTGGSTITFTPVNGFSGTVSLADSTNSTNLTCTLNPTSVSGGSGTSNLSCASATAGNYVATVRGTSGTLSHSAAVTFHVQDFTMVANVTTVETGLGSRANSTITVSPLGGFGGTVNLAAITNSTSISCRMSPTTIGAGSGTSTLTCSSNIPGNYLATVTATSGAISHNASIIYQITSLQGFTLSNNPTSSTFETGYTGSSTVTMGSLNGFTGTVVLTVTTNSTSLACTLSPSVIASGSGTSTLYCTGLGGSYIASVTGDSSGVASKTSRVTFIIQDFVMSTSSASMSIDPGVAGSSSINFDPVEGFTGTIVLSYSVSPVGLTCSLSKSSIFLGTSQAVVLSCFGTAGVYNVTVTGTSGSLSRRSMLSYTIITTKSGTTIQSYFYELAVAVAVTLLASLIVLRKRRHRAAC